ncbi:MAG TPA: hypothetical protein VNJ29_02880 [Candidatus Nitrosotenuis sp.]|jgi:hypothetical protein|nr:hypothetical protein [Candidatus Nitrosotenuis sp.]
MLSKILFTILLSTSLVQVHAAELDLSSSASSEIPSAHKSREQMTRDLYDELFKESFTANSAPGSWKGIQSIDAFEEEIAQRALDKTIPSLLEANWHGYKKAFEEFSDEEISELHAVVSDKTFQDFRASLKKTSDTDYARALREAITGRHIPVTLPPTATYNVLVKQFKQIQHTFEKYETLIRIHAHQAVSESKNLENVVSLLHDGSASNLKEQLRGHLPTATEEALDTLINTVKAKKKDLSWNDIKDMLLQNHSHDLWDGTLSDTAWDNILARKAEIAKDVDIITALMLIKGEISLEFLIPKIPAFSAEEQVDLIKKIALARHNQLVGENDEGFQKFEDFENTYGVTLSIISGVAALHNSPKFNPEKKTIIAGMNDVLKDTLKEAAEEIKAELSVKGKNQAEASEKGEVCQFCGKIHQTDESTDISGQNQQNTNSPGDDAELTETEEGASDPTTTDSSSSDDSDWDSSSDYKPWP